MTRSIIKQGLVVSMDDVHPSPFRGDLLIEDDVIIDIAPAIETEADETIDASGMIVMPGFVNAHQHTWQTALRGVAGDWTVNRYLAAMHRGLATAFQPRDIYIANFIGALNQIDCGTTTLVDWCHNNPTPDHSDAAIDGLVDAGIRAVFFHGSPKPSPKPGARHFSEIPMSRDNVARLRLGRLASSDALVTMGLAVLGPRDSIHEVTRQDLRLAREFGLIASAHTGGLPFMTADAIPRLVAEGLIDSRVNFVHANNVSDDDFKRFVDAGGTVTVTADIELVMAFGDPVTGRLRTLGAPVSVGGDVEPGVTGDMFTAIRTPLQTQRNIDANALKAAGKPIPDLSTISCREAVEWGTINGARMLGIEKRVGSLATGKQADITLLRATDLNIFPVRDAYAAIAMQAHPGNVDTVIIAGKVKKRHGKLAIGDVSAQLAELDDSGARILEATGFAVQ